MQNSGAFVENIVSNCPANRLFLKVDLATKLNLNSERLRIEGPNTSGITNLKITLSGLNWGLGKKS